MERRDHISTADPAEARRARAEAAEAAERSRRRRLAIATALLLIGLPIYFWLASGLVAAITQPVETAEGVVAEGRPIHWALELLIYIGLGLVWAFPMKRLVVGLGKKTGG